MMLYTKYESSGLVVSDKKIIPVKFGQIPISGSREDVV